MYEAVQNCNHCGANLTLDDMRKPNCPYCGTVYPHHAQAAQHAQVMSHMMGQMVAQQAQIQNQWRSAFGVGPVPPPGAPGTPGMPGNPYAVPMQLAQVHQEQASRLAKRVLTIVILSFVGVFVSITLIVAAIIVLG